MHWPDGFIAVDWGTTNRRAYRIEADGSRGPEMEDGKGILAVPDGGFPEAVGEIRARLGDKPLLMAGMVGSNRGWMDAGYVPCPASLAEIAAALRWVEPDRVALVPGVSYTMGEAADVMRGEEVQVLGAVAAGLVPPHSLVCHPGTHNKWVRIEDGRICDFRTVMTGEIYNLLKEHSILADLLGGPTEPGPAFEAGVKQGLAGADLTAELFSVRARVLLGRAPRDKAASYTSGLLIGADLRIGLHTPIGGDVVVIGTPSLTGLFAAALSIAGRGSIQIDGEEAFIAGVRRIVELL